MMNNIESKTEQQIIDEANDLARAFAKADRWNVADDHRFYESVNPRSVRWWNMAVIAYEHLAATDLQDVLTVLKDQTVEIPINIANASATMKRTKLITIMSSPYPAGTRHDERRSLGTID